MCALSDDYDPHFSALASQKVEQCGERLMQQEAGRHRTPAPSSPHCTGHHEPGERLRLFLRRRPRLQLGRAPWFALRGSRFTRDACNGTTAVPSAGTTPIMGMCHTICGREVPKLGMNPARRQRAGEMLLFLTGQ